ncbi:MAG: zf-HC2 domain-containing protein [Nitrospirales bacterium]
MKQVEHNTSQGHRHTKAGCVKILKRLSAYLDDELTADVCKEVRTHMGICPKCEIFLDSLRQTISLCRHFEASPLSPSKKLHLRREIQKAISRA